jgi:glucokinase
MTILAGDIGGTNSRLALFESRKDGLEQVAQRTYPSRDYGCVTEIISEFLAAVGTHCDAVCLGLPGPVSSERITKLTNLPWHVDKEKIRQIVSTDKVELINDVEASAAGVYERPESDFECLREGRPNPLGNRAVISLGTGLGVAGLTPTGRAFATEAGHATFSPRDEIDLDLMRVLGREYDHVSWERVASGPALARIYSFLAPADAPHLDAPEIVNRANSDPICKKTIESFARYVGSAAGNIALTMMATGGIFLCGGVAPRIIDAVGAESILEALVDKGRMRSLLERIPVYLVRDDNLALTGAAQTALRRIGCS